MKGIIQEAEDRWLVLLSEHCRDLFAGIFLPSHDHSHHKRVWSYAKTLMQLLDTSGIKLAPSLPEQLLIAVYFHDAGLIKTLGEKHGRESRKLCEEFFEIQGGGPGLYNVDGMEEILHAIEQHDVKSPDNHKPDIVPGNPPDLLSLLTACDDLDAFGLMGIYRYAEIYLLRGMEPRQLPASVSRNVKDRFMKIKHRFGILEEFIRHQESRYLQVYEFYLRLGQAYAGLGEKPSWEAELIDIIQQSIHNEINLVSGESLLPPNEFRSEIAGWFSLLDREI
jgi:hypothetical protein